MSLSLSPILNGYQSFLANGLPNNGGFIYAYQAGTTTPQPTYTTSAGNIENSNPIQLSASGVPPNEIWLTDGLAYKFVIKDSNNTQVAGASFDNITGIGNVFYQLLLSTGAALVGWIQTGVGAVLRTVMDKLRDQVSVADYGAIGDGTDETAKLQAAINSGRKRIMLADGATYNFTQLKISSSFIELFGSGNSSILNCTSTSVFCAIAVVENCRFVHLHDFTIQGSITSEPGGQSAPAPLRAIVDGTNSAGNAHSGVVWSAFNRFERLYTTGAIPGTNGFNLGCQFNYGNYSSYIDNVVDSIYGTDSSFGYGIVCNGTGQQVCRNRFLATIPDQGRHAVYMTNTPYGILCDGNYALNFQNEAYTSNTRGSTPGTFGYLTVINNIAENCLQVGLVGGSFEQAVIDINAPYSIVAGNTIIGSAFSGVSCFNVEGCIISDNIINGCEADAIWIASCTNTKIHGNQIFNPDSSGTSTFSGVFIQSSNGTEVSNNRIDGTNYAAGVTFNATSPVPTNCQVYDNNITGSYGVDIFGGTLDTSNTVRRTRNEPQELTYTPGATSINVAQNIRTIGGISNSGAVTITTLPGAYIGQYVTMLFFDANTTITRTNFGFAGSVNFVSTAKSTLTVICTNIASGVPQWLEVCRSTSAG